MLTVTLKCHVSLFVLKVPLIKLPFFSCGSKPSVHCITKAGSHISCQSHWANMPLEKFSTLDISVGIFLFGLATLQCLVTLTLVCKIIISNRSLLKKNLLLFILIINDSCMVTTISVAFVATFILNQYVFGRIMCFLWQTIPASVLNNGIYLQSFISLQRFYSVIYNRSTFFKYKYVLLFTVLSTITVFCIQWVPDILYLTNGGFEQFVLEANSSSAYNDVSCVLLWHVKGDNMFIFIGGVAVPVSLSIFFYWRIRKKCKEVHSNVEQVNVVGPNFSQTTLFTYHATPSEELQEVAMNNSC